ncbi:MAG: periplasmic heavy metal sensor [Gemmatimonadota bacterium]|nr:periplasmic heavy metal sensor [Gemmatimonadota bacterium]
MTEDMSGRVKRWGWSLGLLVVLAVAAGAFDAASAQVRGQRRGGGEPPPRSELERRVRARYGEIIRERLGLTEEQHAALGEAMRESSQRRQELMREQRELRVEVADLLAAPEPGEEAARELLRRVAELRSREADLSREEQERLLGVLTPVQYLRLQAIREEMAQRVQRLRGGLGAPPGTGVRMRPGGRVPPGW